MSIARCAKSRMGTSKWLSCYRLSPRSWGHEGPGRQFKHPTKPGLVTVAGRPNEDLAPGTLNRIFKQAGLHP